MDLSLSTHFSQGGQYNAGNADQLLALIGTTGADSIRDGLPWGVVETTAGVYDFSSWRAGYVGQMIDAGLNPILTLMPQGNSLYDGGKTVMSAEGIAAFANFAVAVLDEYPELTRLSIGNEFNTYVQSFISGAALQLSLQERAQLYTDILAAVSDRLAETHPDVQLIGGALHSVPTGYIGYLADAGAFQYIDVLDFHPYGQDPTQVGEILEELNRILDTLPADQRPELMASEFGQSAQSDDPLSNAGYLVKMLAVMGDAGVSEAVWYSLLDEDWYSYPDMGLYDNPDAANDMLPAFQWMSQLLDQGTPTKLASASSVELYQLTDDTYLMWGSHQTMKITGTNLVFRDAAGHVIDRPDALSDAPVFVQGDNVTIAPAQGPGAVRADSFYDFDLQDSLAPAGPGWSYHGLSVTQSGERLFQLQIMDGQSRGGESWNPYLGNAWARPFFLDGLHLSPVQFGSAARPDERAALERYTVGQTGAVDIVGSWSVGAASTDGVRLEIRINGTVVHRAVITDQANVVLRGLILQAGDQVDFVIFANGSSSGDTTTRHIRILEADPSQSAQDILRTHLATDMITGNELRDETLRGSTGNDTLHAGYGNDMLYGGQGNDNLRGNIGRDSVFGGAGNDVLRGEQNDDVLNGGDGHDHLYGGIGNDTLYGSAGNDLLGGGGGDDRVYGGIGDDRLYGAQGHDILSGGDGRDRLYGGADNDTLYGELGDDVLSGGDGRDRLYGGLGNDTLYGGRGDDLLSGFDGHDRLYGGIGNDTLYGGAGNDILSGSADHDRLYGGDGHDTLYGGAGNDLLSGDDGNDRLILGAGNDTARGGAGNDVIVAGAGSNRIDGGAGQDILIAGTGRDVMTGGAGDDHFVFRSAAAIGLGQNRDQITDFTSGIDHINLAALDLTFIGGQAFHHQAGELRFAAGMLMGDLDGDGSADFALDLHGVTQLAASDLIL